MIGTQIKTYNLFITQNKKIYIIRYSNKKILIYSRPKMFLQKNSNQIILL